jgi:hypothetical protein
MLKFSKKTDKFQITLSLIYICTVELIPSIQQYAAVPIPHHVIKWLLKDYKQPNDKIHNLLKRGILEQVKKGLYVAGSAISKVKPNPFLIANHILGPSYISLESALSYHGLIPERVYTITSVTTKATREYTTPLGTFTYTRLPLPYYSYGIRSMEIAPEQRIMIASPEKAIFDKIITTAGVEFRSKISVLTYMENDLRLDIDNLSRLDLKSMADWISTAPKKQTLKLLLETIRGL